MKITQTALFTSALALMASASAAQQTTLRIQTQLTPETPSGQMVQAFVENVEAMSNGEIAIELFMSSSVVDSGDTFDAAVNGIIDCDMTNATYVTGKNAAFQFAADTMGGYDTPMQFQAWIHEGGGAEAMTELYGQYGMTWIGTFIGSQESLVSTTPIRGVEDLKGWKFRSPPGMESEIFSKLGASAVVMDYSEVFTALETNIIDGADSSSLSDNAGVGLYDIGKYGTYPGFHSMAADHLACNSTVWEGLPEHHKTIIKIAVDKLSHDVVTRMFVDNNRTATELRAKGVELSDWSDADRAKFREAAVATWDEWASKTPETATMVESHKSFLTSIGFFE
ncbi:TRAP transporter substrate-binding protein [Paracoccus saliphilus]|uniref:TRAP transporter substrate-binding protein n=1 Tax=Paracoccus saliphilus TaxID=405559 RepID=A0AA46A6Z1_9RHOB|nr:TRAP transporter substrate-binding protein [Paracoccus saliphilus]WCR03854.1 TRAP transporter substrate-binding protein [Paracoccus saliphilus]SIT05433.1 TRAP-type mannitol/chloroaromatic compound transport system, substrate-binding protein [Paracoccus saliphilus]